MHNYYIRTNLFRTNLFKCRKRGAEGQLPPQVFKWVRHSPSPIFNFKKFLYSSSEELFGYLNIKKKILAGPQAPNFDSIPHPSFKFLPPTFPL